MACVFNSSDLGIFSEQITSLVLILILGLDSWSSLACYLLHYTVHWGFDQIDDQIKQIYKFF